jgi:hypothetical protein
LTPRRRRVRKDRFDIFMDLQDRLFGISVKSRSPLPTSIHSKVPALRQRAIEQHAESAESGSPWQLDTAALQLRQLVLLVAAPLYWVGFAHEINSALRRWAARAASSRSLGIAAIAPIVNLCLRHLLPSRSQTLPPPLPPAGQCRRSALLLALSAAGTSPPSAC